VPQVDGLETEIAALIIGCTGLEDVQADQIDPLAPLFGTGLGLDSIDALEIGVALNKRFGVKLTADSDENRRHFASLRDLARFVGANRVTTHGG
jgi:acyl carrier protein